MAYPNFSGFTYPDGTFLPPEVIYLLPNMTHGQLKTLLVILYHFGQFGGGEGLSLTDIEHLTGLSRPTVTAALQDLVEESYVDRVPVGQSFCYVPRVANFTSKDFLLVKSSNQFSRESESKLNLNNSLSDSLPDSLNSDGEKLELLRELRAAGVYLKTAQSIVARHSAETIRQHLNYYLYALEKNLAQGAGWFVMSINEDWPAPLGFADLEDEADQRQQYAQWDSTRRQR